MSILWTERECKEDGGEEPSSTSPIPSPTSALPINIASIPIPPIPLSPPTTRQRTTSTSSATSNGGSRKTGRPRSGKGKSGKTIRGSGTKEYKAPEGAAKRTWRRPDPTPDAEGRKRLTDVLRNRDVFAICLAAIGHDVGHPGNSNAFMVRLTHLSFEKFTHCSTRKTLGRRCQFCTMINRLLNGCIVLFSSG